MYIDKEQFLDIEFQTAKSSNNLEVVASVVLPGGNKKNFNGDSAISTAATPVKIFSGAGTIEEMYIYNADTVSHVVEIGLHVDGNKSTVFRKDMSASTGVQYTRFTGFISFA